MSTSSLKTFRVKVPKSMRSPDSCHRYANSGYQDSSSSGSCSNDLANTVYSVPHEPPMLNEEWFENNKINSALNAKTARIHERPQRRSSFEANKRFKACREKSRRSNVSRVESFSKKIRYLNEEISKRYKKCRLDERNMERKEAWGKSGVTGAEKTRRNSDDTDSEELTSDRVKMGDLCLALDRIDCWNHPKEIPELECNYIDDLPSQHSVKQVRSESVISMKPFDPKLEGKSGDKRTAHIVRPGSARSEPTKTRQTPSSPDKKPKNMRSSRKITDSDIKKLYNNLSPEEVLQLQKAYNGLIGTRRDKSKTPSKTTMEDVDTFRETAMRATNYPYLSRTAKDWKTSYNSDFGKRPTAREVFENVNTLYKSEFIDPKPRPGSPIPKPGKGNAKKEASMDGKKTAFTVDEQQFTDEEKERIMQEAAKIMDREYKASLSLDGKSKLANETSSSNYGAYKSWGIKKQPVPIWADKTVKSLGSGHWNLPWNKEGDWKLKAEHAQGDEEFVPSGRTKPAFKLHLSDPTKEKFGQEAVTITDLDGFNQQKILDKSSKVSDDPFIALYYPDVRTNSNYLSEYMRKFHKLPLPRKQARV